ncbi:MAG: AAA family ATPase, partial [Candidatus Tectomicrobia bacterium]
MAAKFCSACGTPLRVVCLACRAENLPSGTFCTACGQSLASVTPALAGDGDPKPLSYTPKYLADEILTTRSALEGERKHVTVLFCDLDNSMLLADRLGPEGMHTLLNRFFELALNAVHQYGGTINQFLGDGFMALFGAPLAHEDHARRGVLAALEVQRSLQTHQGDFERLQAEEEATPPLPIQVCMGLNTGPVVVGSIGDNLRLDYTAVGDTTNLAARLQQFAEPETILIGASTARLVPDATHLEPMGPISVKGKPDPVAVHKVVGLEARRPLLGARPLRVLNRFVGRGRELQSLHTLQAQAENGQGQVLGLVGEPGMGKSRLLYEFRQGLADPRLTYLEGRCISYGGMMPYLPVLDMLRHHCGITEADSPASLADKVHARLHEVGMAPDEDIVYLFQLLGLKEGTERLAILSSETLKARLVDTLRRMLLKGSRQQPLIIVIEDLHWIDQSSEDFLTLLVEGLVGAAILLLTTYRPGYQPSWIGKSYVTQITLPRLDPQDSLSVLYSVLKRETLPHALGQMILQRADGNPMFLEELAHALTEQDHLGEGAAVPDTIQGVLAARIDRLPDALKRLLQTASVLGRSFSPPLLEMIWNETDDLTMCLQELKRLEFLYEEDDREEPLYIFRHALLQEVAYDTLLITRQRQLHAAVGEALESHYADRLADVYDRLAYHFSKAARHAPAVLYLTRFAEQAADEHAHVEAVTALQEALTHAARAPANAERERQLLDLHLRLTRSLSALGRDQDVLDQLSQQQERLDQLQDAELTGRYALLRSQSHSNLGDWQQAAQNAQHALEAAAQCHDEMTLGQAYHVLAMQRYWMGQPRQGVDYSQQAIAALERAGQGYRVGMSHFVLGLNALVLGDFDHALQAVATARAIGETIEDARLQTFAAWTSGWIHATRGAWDDGIATCQGALASSSDPLNTAFAMGWLGYAYLEKKVPADAIPLLEQAVQRLRQYSYRRLEGLYSTFLAEAHVLQGDLDTARFFARQGLTRVRDEQYRTGIAWAQRTLGRIALAEDALAVAQEYLRDALTTFVAIQARFEAGRTHLDLADLAQHQQDRQAITLHLTEAHQLFTALHV